MHIKKILLLTFIGTVMLFLRVADAGAALAGDSRTYFQSWESLDESRHHTLYEYLDIDVEGLGGKGLSFHFGGWGRADLADESYGESTNGEFQYGYLNYAHGKANTVARVGRVYVSEGVALHENLDGLYARGDLARGFAFALYGGVPVETEEDGRESDFIYGGRLAFRRPGSFEAGVSYLREDNDGTEFREEAGVDVSLQVGRNIRLDGQSTFNMLDSEWSDHDYRLALGAYKGWRFVGTAWRVDYDSYFQSPATSAFLPQALEAGETLLLLGGELEYAVTPQLALAFAYQAYTYDIADSADAYSGLLTWTPPEATVGLVIRRVDGATDPLRYSEYRGYASRRFGAFDVVFDALRTVYDEQINGEDKAYTIVLGGGYNFHSRLRLGADVEYGSNPFFEEEVKAFVKLLWRFSAGTSARGEE